MHKQKEDALAIAKERVNALSKSTLLDFCEAVEIMDRKISSTMKEMASSLAHMSGIASAESQKATRQALEDLSLAVVQPRKVKGTYIETIKDWCRHEGKLRYVLLSLCSRRNKIVGSNVGGQ